jgi:alpha-aminoadipic semialdehyde synthase
MKNCIGIRRESKDLTEQRVPLTPTHVKELIENYRIRVIVKPSEERIFKNIEYKRVGAEISTDLSDCNIIFGVKEVPIPDILPDKAYCIFSHTFKAQQYNMPMLNKMLEFENTLLDYELVRDKTGKRIMYFGDYAGYAGMIDSLWTLGQRLLWEGIDNPFKRIKQANKYSSFEKAKNAIRDVGKQISEKGLPKSLVPFICGFTGYGHVSKSAQKLYELLPVQTIKANQLSHFFESGNYSNRYVYKVEFTKPDMFHPITRDSEIGKFDLDEFRNYPENYQSKFEQYVPYLNLLINGIFWEPVYPRIITKGYLKLIYSITEQPRLRAIGDITCDPHGSIEVTVKSTNSENPVYIYEPLTDKVIDGWKGNGPVILAVDKLPTEIPIESSEDFGRALLPFVPQLAAVNFDTVLESLKLPYEFRNAMITHQGKILDKYEYLKEYL